MSSPASKNSLTKLPNDLFLDVIEYLDTARDVASLESSTRHCRNIIARDGWRTFVRNQFPSLNIPIHDQTDWSRVAQRLTYLDRCWERRAFSVCTLNELQQAMPKKRSARSAVRGQSVKFQAVLDAQYIVSQRQELLVAGAGENLMIKLCPDDDNDGKGVGEKWYQIPGKKHGYQPGTGDVTAVSAMERDGTSQVIVGRANGHVRILSQADNFEETLQTLLPVSDDQLNHKSDPMKRSPGQLAVSWTEWQPRAQLLASTRGSLLTLHSLGESSDDEKSVEPMAFHDFSKGGGEDEACLARSVKFMSKDTMAVALGGSREPLRWAKITPVGLEMFSAASNLVKLDNADVKLGEKTTVRAIEPVPGSGNGNLLLSAWDDGTYRLMDIRTPSAQDAVYRDRFQPYEAGSSLLVYGTERFVAGSNAASSLRLFDFRYPKPYHHTTATSCSSSLPFPIKDAGTSLFRSKLETEKLASRCSPASGRACPWHALSRWDCCRPDATLHLRHSTYDHVYSLAKSSDGSGKVHAGLRGAIMELDLLLLEDVPRLQQQQKRPTPPGWQYGLCGDGNVSLIETGISLMEAPEWAIEDRGVPRLIPQQYPTTSTTNNNHFESWNKTHRLDGAFQTEDDVLEKLRWTEERGLLQAPSSHPEFTVTIR